jgi:hypothetical protein
MRASLVRKLSAALVSVLLASGLLAAGQISAPAAHASLSSVPTDQVALGKMLVDYANRGLLKTYCTVDADSRVPCDVNLGGIDAIYQQEIYPLSVGQVPSPGAPCSIDTRVLQLLVLVIDHFQQQVHVTDLERYCIHSQLSTMQHGAQAGHGGWAVDIDSIGGVATNGSSAKNADLLLYLSSIKPTRGQLHVGQSQCGRSLAYGFSDFPDSCTHQHIDFSSTDVGLNVATDDGSPSVISSPTSVPTPDGHVQTFRSVGGQVVQNWYDPGTGNRGPGVGLSPGPGVAGSPVAVARSGTQVIDVFFLGSDHQLWATWYNWGTGAIGGATGIAGATFSSDPTVAATSDGHVQLFAISGSTVYHGWYAPTTGEYGGWGAIVSGPGAVGRIAAAPRTGTQNIDLVFRGTDNQMWTNWYNWGTGGSGGGIGIAGATFASDPTVTPTPDGHLQLFATSGQTVLHGWYAPSNGQYGGWGGIVSGPGAVGRIAATPRAGTQNVDLVFRGTDNQIWTNWYNWGSGASGGGIGVPGATFDSNPATYVSSDAKVQIFATTAGSLKQDWYDPAHGSYGGWVTLP